MAQYSTPVVLSMLVHVEPSQKNSNPLLPAAYTWFTSSAKTAFRITVPDVRRRPGIAGPESQRAAFAHCPDVVRVERVDPPVRMAAEGLVGPGAAVPVEDGAAHADRPGMIGIDRAYRVQSIAGARVPWRPR